MKYEELFRLGFLNLHYFTIVFSLNMPDLLKWQTALKPNNDTDIRMSTTPD
jgi:hypothetical protein